MRLISLLGSLALLALPLMAEPPSPPKLMPLPAKIEPGEAFLAVNGDFTVANIGATDARLDAAVERFLAQLQRQTGVPLRQAKPAQPPQATLVIDCKAKAPGESPVLGEDESYQIDVGESQARLNAKTTTGALRGLQTLLQLVQDSERGFEFPSVHIDDKPRFPWRGLMIDVSRHWMDEAVILRNLDAMAAVKLNVFHWHLSDDQGWRVESRRYPKLQELCSDGRYYTQDQIRHVIEYAKARGIRVVPEFDVPGHTSAILKAYPELGSAPGPYEIERRWGIFVPTLDPTKDETYQFLDGLFTEMASLFPDPYFHIGGDEVEGSQWKNSESIQAWKQKQGMKEDRDLHVAFNRRLLEILKRNHKIMIGWDEVFAPGLPTETVIQSWRGPDSLAEAARQGYRGILSYGYYLDHMDPASFHYGFDPLPAGSKLNTKQAELILGGEACMWDEYATAETVDSRLWPRLAAIAERFWSPRTVTDVDSMYDRLETINRYLDWTGVQHRAHRQAMLARIAGNRQLVSLPVLADVVESEGIGVRAESRAYTSFIPMNRLVDATPKESELVRKLDVLAKRLAKGDAVSAGEIAWMQREFHAWAANDERFRAESQGHHLMKELGELSARLSATGEIGLEALRLVQTKAAAPAGWVAAEKAKLKDFEKPEAEVRLAAVRPVLTLLEAVEKSGK